MTIRRKGLANWLSAALWVGASLAATYFAYGSMRYHFTSSHMTFRAVLADLSGPRSWPTETDYSYSLALATRSPDTITIVAFLSPSCLCTQTTVEQLTRTWRDARNAELIVLVVVPDRSTAQQAWEQAEYVKLLRAAIPTASVVYDRGGIQAWRFGVSHSGTVLVYDRQEHEIFRGGVIDPSKAVEARVFPQFTQAVTAGIGPSQTEPIPVVGCPLDARSCPLRSPSTGSGTSGARPL